MTRQRGLNFHMRGTFKKLQDTVTDRLKRITEITKKGKDAKRGRASKTRKSGQKR